MLKRYFNLLNKLNSVLSIISMLAIKAIWTRNAEVIDVVRQFAFESSEDILKDVALDVLVRATLYREVNGGDFQHPRKKYSKDKWVKMS